MSGADAFDKVIATYVTARNKARYRVGDPVTYNLRSGFTIKPVRAILLADLGNDNVLLTYTDAEGTKQTITAHWANID